MSSKFVVSVFVILILTACGGSDNENSSSTISISGAVQKGPFIVGTPVYINRLDELGNASESTVIAEVEDSIGSFSFNVDKSGPVQIISNGYYFSELTGQISSGTLTLKAIYDASEENEQKAFVNILTHLINDRILGLIKDGEMTLQNAITQAQSELISALNPVLPIDNIPDFSALSIYNIGLEKDVGNAYLLALSTAFYKYAEIKANGQNTSADAQLSLILNLIAVDLADDGLIQHPGFVQDLTAALRKLNPKAITDNLVQRSSIDFSDPLDIPDITRFFGLCVGSAKCAWSARSPMPVAISQHGSAQVGTKIYIFGGVSSDENYSDPTQITETSYTSVYMYDVETNQWEKKSPMPVGLTLLRAHAVGDSIYILGGYRPGGVSNVTLRYNPVVDEWSQLTSMSTSRHSFSSEVIEGKIYVIGGSLDSGEYTDSVEVYDPILNSWEHKMTMPKPLTRAASCAVGDEIYILGGYSYGMLSHTYVYNTNDDTWTERSPSLISRLEHVCVPVGNQMYLIGGRNLDDGWSPLDAIELYNSEIDKWTELDRALTARYYFSATNVEGKIYLIGGIGDSEFNLFDSVEVLDTSILDIQMP